MRSVINAPRRPALFPLVTASIFKLAKEFLASCLCAYVMHLPNGIISAIPTSSRCLESVAQMVTPVALRMSRSSIVAGILLKKFCSLRGKHSEGYVLYEENPQKANAGSSCMMQCRTSTRVTLLSVVQCLFSGKSQLAH